jgi:hypothetical protein
MLSEAKHPRARTTRSFAALRMTLAMWLRCVGSCLGLIGLALLPHCAIAAAGDLPGQIDASLARAARFLVERQDADGAWRSKAYSALADGPALTAHVLTPLHFLPATNDSRRSFERGVDYLVKMAEQTAAADGDLRYPVYTAAAASWVVVLENRSPGNVAAHERWLACLKQRQLTESLGWSPADESYGGWGYSIELPTKPPAGMVVPPLMESNLSATLYALGALRSAHAGIGDRPDYGPILAFVERCQNFSDDASRGEERFDDGGFFLTPNDAAKNKAGVAGVDRLGRTRFHSYGSMTADGLRALLHCGLPENHPRVSAARRWLERNFRSDANPGAFEPDREVLRNATYFYYCWSVSHAFMHLRSHEIQTAGEKVRWAEVLAGELLHRQRPDGAWVNEFTDSREDDPLVATPHAAAALAICRLML